MRKPLLIHSNAPTSATGYGMQAAMLGRRLKAAGFDVAFSCFYGIEGHVGEWEGMPMFPTDVTRFGKVMLPYYAAHWAGDDMDPRDLLVLTIMDSWVLAEAYQALKDMRLACWSPVDHEPCPPRIVQMFTLTDARPIAMSRFGESEFRGAGLDPYYAPHAVETDVFRPRDRQEARARLGLPQDAYVVGMVANNKGITPPRKAHPQVFQAFKVFTNQHPDVDAHIYVHCDVAGFDQGLNIRAMADVIGIPEDRLHYPDQLRYHIGAITPEELSWTYSAFDVMANPSYGEGFGVPIVEAQACGTPVIVTEWTAMTELVGPGWLVDGDPWYDAGHGAFFKCPAVMEIVEALEKAYRVRNDEVHRRRAREFAVQYDADRVFEENWLPIMDDLFKPREIGPLVPAREAVA